MQISINHITSHVIAVITRQFLNIQDYPTLPFPSIQYPILQFDLAIQVRQLFIIAEKAVFAHTLSASDC